ncbi:DUF4396 domain-containing protein [Micromonospora sp. NPDC051006]|uniref:DUF4396 domain-containing protein n=1 Tax=Micromonospora sp. NPDC051006 TaxID=3364283 RepID=UPI0037A00A4B
MTARRVHRTGLDLRHAVLIAFVADTLSITVMELLNKAVLVAIPGALDTNLSTANFGLSLAGPLAVAFVVSFPVNRCLIAWSRGHAVVPGHHYP